MRIYLVHSWDAYTTQHGIDDWHPPWYDWIEMQYPKDSGITVTNLRMPNSSAPEIDAWVSALEYYIPKIDENTIFIGHSIGCQAIMRYLAKKNPQTIGGAIFVAGWFELTNLETPEAEYIAKPWIETPIDFTTLAKFRKDIHVIISDDDQFVPLDPNQNLFKKYISDDVITVDVKSHFDNVSSLPIVKEIIDKIIQSHQQ